MTFFKFCKVRLWPGPDYRLSLWASPYDSDSNEYFIRMTNMPCFYKFYCKMYKLFDKYCIRVLDDYYAQFKISWIIIITYHVLGSWTTTTPSLKAEQRRLKQLKRFRWTQLFQIFFIFIIDQICVSWLGSKFHKTLRLSNCSS